MVYDNSENQVGVLLSDEKWWKRFSKKSRYSDCWADFEINVALIDYIAYRWIRCNFWNQNQDWNQHNHDNLAMMTYMNVLL